MGFARIPSRLFVVPGILGESHHISLRVGFFEQPNDQALLSVQPVFGFVDNQAAAAFDDFGRDFFTTPSGQAVQKLRIVAEPVSSKLR